MHKSIPKYLHKYFWGDDLKSLNWEEHEKYISGILLEKGDKKAIHWLLKNVNKKELLSRLDTLKLESKSLNFWKLYLS